MDNRETHNPRINAQVFKCHKSQVWFCNITMQNQSSDKKPLKPVQWYYDSDEYKAAEEGDRREQVKRIKENVDRFLQQLYPQKPLWFLLMHKNYKFPTAHF